MTCLWGGFPHETIDSHPLHIVMHALSCPFHHCGKYADDHGWLTDTPDPPPRNHSQPDDSCPALYIGASEEPLAVEITMYVTSAITTGPCQTIIESCLRHAIHPMVRISCLNNTPSGLLQQLESLVVDCSDQPVSAQSKQGPSLCRSTDSPLTLVNSPPDTLRTPLDENSLLVTRIH